MKHALEDAGIMYLNFEIIIDGDKLVFCFNELTFGVFPYIEKVRMASIHEDESSAATLFGH